jgi:hypothetical protein
MLTEKKYNALDVNSAKSEKRNAIKMTRMADRGLVAACQHFIAVKQCFVSTLSRLNY